MPRYEGMDDLLKGVRERLEGDHAGAEEASSDGGGYTVSMPLESQAYERVISHLVLLLREAEKLREMIGSNAGAGLDDDQSDHLLGLLGQVLEELWTCEAMLQGVH